MTRCNVAPHVRASRRDPRLSDRAGISGQTTEIGLLLNEICLRTDENGLRFIERRFFRTETAVTDFELALLRLKTAEALMESEELRQSAIIRSPIAKAHHERLDEVLEETKALLARLSGSDE
jgi:hypothetical protein